MARVVRAVLGMANRRDGGRVIIGVEDTGGVLSPTGLNQSELTSWRYDDVAARISAYVDPSVSFDLEFKEYENNNFVILHVDEFVDIPVLCKSDYPDILRSGACYVRSRRKPETSEIPTQADMRDLLELATEKSLRKWVAQARQAGVIIFPTISPSASDQELFNDQLRDLI